MNVRYEMCDYITLANCLTLKRHCWQTFCQVQKLHLLPIFIEIVSRSNFRIEFTGRFVFDYIASPRPVFLAELVELISAISSDSNAGLLLCADMNCAGTDANNVGDDLQSVFDSFVLTQHVNRPKGWNNLLHIIVTEVHLAISGLSVDDAGLVSDYHPVLAEL